MRSVSAAGRHRGRAGAAWWSVTLLLEAVFLFLTFVSPSDWQIRFSWLPLSPLMAGVIGLLALTILLRSVAPWVPFAAGMGLALVFAYGFEPRVSLIGLVFHLTFSGAVTFSTTPLRRAAPLAAGLIVAFTAGMIVVRGTSAFHLIPLTMIAALSIALFSGQMMRARRRLLESTLRRAAEAEQTREALAARRVAEQRLTTARDLHDVVGHELAVINLYARVASDALERSPGSAKESLDVIEASAARILLEIRELLRELRRDEAVAPAAETLTEALPRLAATLSAGGLPVELELDRDLPPLPAPVDETVYRIVEEALVNAYKHGSPGRPARATITWDRRTVSVLVTNPVTGETSTSMSGGLGLLGIQERAETLGGASRVAIGQGVFELHVDIPIGAR